MSQTTPIAKTIKHGLAALVAFAIPHSAAFADELVLDGVSWTAETGEDSAARVEPYLGRTALFLKRTMAVLEEAEFEDMVIEYDYASTHPSGFIGVNFRANAETANLEQFYTRGHQSGQPDATQYMVMTNGVATWQLHAGPNEAVATDLPAETWIKVRIVAIGDKADIYVGDMSEPLIHVPELRSSSQSGKVALYASDRPWMKQTGAYFSNVSVRAATPEDEIVGSPTEVAPQPEGLITSFQVSAPFAEAEISDAFQMPDLDAFETEWTTLDVENDGVANLARTTPLKDGKNTVLVRIKVTAQDAETRLLQFGYSDRIRLFQDNKLVYSGNAQWRSRDHRFLGTIALADSIAVHLEPGDNEIIAAVSESFGGWGIKAAWSE